MAISVYLGKVTKRKNSTFRPSLTAAVNVVLKEGTSDTRPAFLLNSNEPVDANYLIWGDRYYFIDDVTYERNNLYTIRCSLDVLATYKSYIAATSAFVAYDGTSNTQIVDGRLSIETTKTVVPSTHAFNKLGSGTCIVISVVGDGSTTTFAVEPGVAQVLMDSINIWMNGVDVLPIPEMQSITDIAEAIGIGVENLVRIARQFIATGKAADCIRNAFLLPVSRSFISTSSGSPIHLGEYNTALPGHIIQTGTVVTDHISLSIPWQATDWRRNAPYSRLYLDIPYVGCMEIPTGEIIGDEQLTILTYLAPTSGDVVFQVASGTRIIATMSTNLASTYAIGAANVTPLAAASSVGMAAIGVVGAVATGGVTAALSATAGIIGSTNNLSPMPSSVGTNAGSASIGLPPAATLYSVYHDTNVSPGSVAGAIGTPTMAVRSLGGLSGYVECRAASVSAPAETAVLDTINNYLNSGFFME